MRIFDLDTLLSFAFYPDGNKKLKRTSQEYRLNIGQFCKNGSEPINGERDNDSLINMQVMCLGLGKKKFKKFKKLKYEIKFQKFQIVEKGNFLIEKEFCTPDSNKPYPLLMLYKKQLDISQKVKLFDLLKPFFNKIIRIHEEKNSPLGQSSAEETAVNRDSEHQNKITKIANDIFKELENTRKDISIIGIFLDPYFIRKEHNNLVLVDTRPADTLPRKKKDIQQEPVFYVDNVHQEADHLEIEDYTNYENHSDDDFLFLDQFFVEPMDNEIKKVDKISEEVNINRKLGSSATISDSITNNILVVSETNSFVWNSETKEKIENSLKEYQKHLHKNCFFYDASITKNKLTFINKLLNKLDEPSFQAFFCLVNQEATTAILKKHRNILCFPILSYLFNLNKKTRGELLLENIYSHIKENNSTTFSA